MLRYIIVFVSALAYLEATRQYISLGDNVRYYKSSENLYYVMEKVTTAAQAQLWIEFFILMEGGNIDLRTNISDRPMKDHENPLSVTIDHLLYLTDNEFIHVTDVNNNIRAGAGSAGQVTVKRALGTFNYEQPVELWICYAWSSYETPSGPAKVEDLMKIEMAVTVTTRAPFLYTWHMGITRNFLWKQAPGVIIHSGISVPIHSFAALVMSAEHPKLYYVMSAPMGEMQNILKKALAPHIGHTVLFHWYGKTGVLDILTDTTTKREIYRLHTLPKSSGGRQLIFEGTKEELFWPSSTGTSGVEFLADIRTLAEACPADKSASLKVEPPISQGAGTTTADLVSTKDTKPSTTAQDKTSTVPGKGTTETKPPTTKTPPITKTPTTGTSGSSTGSSDSNRSSGPPSGPSSSNGSGGSGKSSNSQPKANSDVTSPRIVPVKEIGNGAAPSGDLGLVSALCFSLAAMALHI